MRALAILAALAAVPAAADPHEEGRDLSILHCGRCHVVPGGNRFGSIGLTPSFEAMRAYPDWQARFEAFWSEPPHAAITEVTGVSPPLDPDGAFTTAPVRMSEAELDAILAYVATITPKDVGQVDAR